MSRIQIQRKLILRIILFGLTIGLFNSCSFKSHFIENEFGRIQLKKMKFKDSFKSEMADEIDTDSIYFFSKISSFGETISYSYLKLYKTGQYASFFGDKEQLNTNDLRKAYIVGYYNVENNKLILEYPRRGGKAGGKRKYKIFEIKNNGCLVYIPGPEYPMRVYTKKKLNYLYDYYPDW